ncbi:MAG: 4'-phosphopantetheinyl transferase superfamily protein [Clostridia bacterium]|nr:4'-phosphopantetheinyl transferase superfamily protein [Clostridia bacterium]
MSFLSVYFANIDDFDTQSLIDSLPSERREYVLGCNDTQKRKQSATAGALLMYALRVSEHSDCTLHNVSGKWLVKTPDNERSLSINKNKQDIFCSITHTENIACIALSSAEVGIDSEFDSDRIFKVANRYFCQNEKTYISQTPASAVYFWTAKESYAKYTGKGLKKPLDSFELRPIDFGLSKKYGVATPFYRMFEIYDKKILEQRIYRIEHSELPPTTVCTALNPDFDVFSVKRVIETEM